MAKMTKKAVVKKFIGRVLAISIPKIAWIWFGFGAFQTGMFALAFTKIFGERTFPIVVVGDGALMLLLGYSFVTGFLGNALVRVGRFFEWFTVGAELAEALLPFAAYGVKHVMFEVKGTPAVIAFACFCLATTAAMKVLSVVDDFGLREALEDLAIAGLALSDSAVWGLVFNALNAVIKIFFKHLGAWVRQKEPERYERGENELARIF